MLQLGKRCKRFHGSCIFSVLLSFGVSLCSACVRDARIVGSERRLVHVTSRVACIFFPLLACGIELLTRRFASTAYLYMLLVTSTE